MTDINKWNELLTQLENSCSDSAVLDQFKSLRDESLAKETFLATELGRFRLMVDMTPCTISWIKKDLTYAGVNKMLCELCEMEESDFVGQTVGHHTNQEYIREFSRELFSSQFESLNTNLDTIIDGDEKKFYIVGTKFNNNEEAVIIGLDITDFSNLQKTVGLMERLSALGEMVAGIVHEINNPLTVVMNRAKMIEKYHEKNEPEKIIDAAQSIQKTGVKMAKIIEGVKSFVRQGQHDPHTEAYVHETLQEAVLLVESKIKAADVKVSLPQGVGPVVNGNQTQLYQVFVNLITNSIDAIAELPERWIDIKTEEKNGVISIFFTDSGPGIAADQVEKIFQSFYTTKEKGKGTGVGLSLCKKILAAHEGDLTIDHSKDNTCFIVTLPA
jgi:signal transduction histidine kinase